jgi:hypothetical protein
VEQEHLTALVEHDEPNRAAALDGQVVRQLH